MRTTIDLRDALYRQAKAEAALRGRKLRDLIEEDLPRHRRGCARRLCNQPKYMEN
jgi:hypothetical protein